MSIPSRWLLIPLIAGYLVSTALLAWRLGATNHALSTVVHAQVTNRASNVESWCNAINAGRDYDRQLVANVGIGTIKYTLKDLPCEALVAKTLKSAQSQNKK